MKTLLTLLAVLCILGGATTAIARNKVDLRLTEQLVAIIAECEKVTPGMTRADLLKVFTTEGGLSSGRHRTYVYAGCPNIKVDVEFAEADVREEKPADVITKISQPYLQLNIAD